MKNVLRIGVVTAALLPVVGCGWLFGEEGMFRDRSEDYRQAQLESPLRVPDQLSDSAIDDAYPVPPLTEDITLTGEFVVPRPDPLEGDPSAQLVKIQRLSSEQWILIEAPPGEVWPTVRSFLNRAQLSTGRIDPVLGIMETAWLEPADDSQPQERYRFRIEQGVQRGTSEVYVLQDRIGGDDWPQSSDNVERENGMVQELAQFIANSAVQGGMVSMVAEQALDSRGKVFLKRDAEKRPYLELQLPFVRAWASLGLALEKASFKVEDLNRSEREYWVRSVPQQNEEDDCGWFSSLFGCDDEETVDGRSFTVTMQPNGNHSVVIRIATREGEPLTEIEAEVLLKRIKGFLS